MFTGIIKLAQIDDYINPSQNCIKPKLILQQEITKKATVSLNDCLACSGCITSAQSILIDQMSTNKFISYTKSNQPIYMIISKQSLLSFACRYKVDVLKMYKLLYECLTAQYTNIKVLYDMQQGIQLCHKLILQQFLQRYKQNKIILCGQCPGWICYAQKTLNKQIVQLISHIKSPQQIMANLIKINITINCKVIAIMPCYDKKLQAIRFQIQQNKKQLDLTLTTNQLQQLLHQNLIKKLEQNNDNSNNIILPNRILSNKSIDITFFKKQYSNGYIDNLLRNLGINNYTNKIIKNIDMIEYQFTYNQKIIKMLKCYGFKNIKRIEQMLKKQKCPYIYIEIMACPGGCYAGGGQIKYQFNQHKQIIKQMEQQAQKYQKQSNLQQQEIILNNQNVNSFKVNYKSIEKTLTQTVMDW